MKYLLILFYRDILSDNIHAPIVIEQIDKEDDFSDFVIEF